jgi:hypothetical protein
LKQKKFENIHESGMVTVFPCPGSVKWIGKPYVNSSWRYRGHRLERTPDGFEGDAAIFSDTIEQQAFVK